MIKKNLIANFIGQGWRALMSLAFVPVYIHILGIESYGLIGTYALLQTWLGLLDMGMTPTLSREMARYTGGTRDSKSTLDLLRTFELLALAVGCTIAVGVWLGSMWLAQNWIQADNLSPQTVANAFSMMAVVTSFRFLENIYRSGLVGLQRQVFLNMIIGIFSTLQGIGSILVLWWVSPTILAFFAWQAILSLVMVIAMRTALGTCFPAKLGIGRFSLKEIRSVGRFASGMFGISFLVLMLTQSDKIILSRMLSLPDFGYYSLAGVVASGLFTLVVPITQAWFPRLSELHAMKDETNLAKKFHEGCQLVTVLIGSAAIVVCMFSGVLLDAWTQDPEISQHTATLVSLLVVGNMLNCLMWIPYQTQLAFGWTSLGFYLNLFSVMVIVPLIILVTPSYGAEGAALVWCLLNVGYLTIGANLMFNRILVRERWKWYVHDTLLPLMAAAAMASLLKYFSVYPQTAFHQLSLLLVVSTLTLLSAAMMAGTVRFRLLTTLRNFFGSLKTIRASEHP